MDVDELGKRAIKKAIKALKRRHLVEEAAHAPAINALSRPWAALGLEWKEKAENLELELQQCYKAQSRLSEQLVVEVAECRSSKSLLEEKELLQSNLQAELAQTREENSQLKESLEEKIKALELLISENTSLKAQLEEVILKLKNAEAENKSLIDRWMLEKMKDAEKLNEINSMYEEMMNQLKVNSIEQLARQQVDGIVRQQEFGYQDFNMSSVPTTCARTITHAHEGSCGSLLFQPNSQKLITGGQDRLLKTWDSNTGTLTSTLHGCLGSVLDLAITHDNRFIIASSSNNALYVWDTKTSRIQHTLTGHGNKVCAVDACRGSNRNIISASYDHDIKVWDLNKGFCVQTIPTASNCNALQYTVDGLTVCSGHVDGHLRLWDVRSGKLISEIDAHRQAITSVCLSRSGNIVLTSGRDNMHNLFDVRTLEVCGTFWNSGNKLASNWSRTCLSDDENYVAAGSENGTVHVWSRLKDEVKVLEGGHSSPVLTCSWGWFGKCLASGDKNGNVCIWT